VIAAYRGWKRLDDSRDPLLTFGNGEHIPVEVLIEIVDLSQQFTVPAEWQDGDVALIDNHRVMHGRYSYSGEQKRKVIVCLAR